MTSSSQDMKSGARYQRGENASVGDADDRVVVSGQHEHLKVKKRESRLHPSWRIWLLVFSLKPNYGITVMDGLLRRGSMLAILSFEGVCNGEESYGHNRCSRDPIGVWGDCNQIGW